MSLLLVNDRDGRIVAELETDDQVTRVVEAMASDNMEVPEYLCLVECRAKHGSLVGTDTSIKSRSPQSPKTRRRRAGTCGEPEQS
jgi:hypothetical protein